MALRLAEELDAEILSVDSMQVYREMDVGTAKPDRDTRARVPHHMIDLVDPEDEFTVAEFQERARTLLKRRIILVGGSGLHFRAVIDPLSFPSSDPAVRAELDERTATENVDELLDIDPDAALHVDLTNPRRVVRALEIYRLTGNSPSRRSLSTEAEAVRSYRSLFEFKAVGLDPGDRLADRVGRRLERMIHTGFLDEVRELAPRLGRTASQAVGYKQLLPVVRGEVAVEVGVAEAIRATLRLAKHQRTYFHRDPRIVWVPWSDDHDTLYEAVRSVFEEATE
jgi:tRNA dimethylallyltransferase